MHNCSQTIINLFSRFSAVNHLISKLNILNQYIQLLNKAFVLWLKIRCMKLYCLIFLELIFHCFIEIIYLLVYILWLSLIFYFFRLLLVQTLLFLLIYLLGHALLPLFKINQIFASKLKLTYD